MSALRPQRWQVWKNTRGRVMGVCIIYRCADYGIELSNHMKFHSALDNADNLEFCEELCKVLNDSGFANADSDFKLSNL